MNEETRKNEISDEQLEDVNGGEERTIPTVLVWSPEQVGVLFKKKTEE